MRRFLNLLLVLLTFLLLVNPKGVQAQLSPFSLGVQAGVSYSGWNLALVGQCHWKDFSAYLGPSISLNRGLPGKGPVGLNTGLNYHIASKKAWLGSLVNLDYQLHFFSAAAAKASMIHELHICYGLEFKIAKAFSIVQMLGYGGYLESNAPYNGLARRNFSGYGGLVRLKASYRF